MGEVGIFRDCHGHSGLRNTCVFRGHFPSICRMKESRNLLTWVTFRFQESI